MIPDNIKTKLTLLAKELENNPTTIKNTLSEGYLTWYSWDILNWLDDSEWRRGDANSIKYKKAVLDIANRLWKELKNNDTR